MKKWLALAAMICLALSVTACGKNAGNTSQGNSAETSKEKQADQQTSKIVGTYIGLNGSCMIVYPDETLDYYFILLDKATEKIPYIYANDMLKFSYKAGSYEFDVFANMEKGDTSDFMLRAESDGWDDEEFIRISDKADKLPLDEQDLLIYETIGERNAFEENIGGIKFRFSGYYQKKDDTYACMLADVGIAAGKEKAGIDAKTFDTKRDELKSTSKELLAGSIGNKDLTLLEEKDFECAGEKGYSFLYSGNANGQTIKGEATFINNTKESTLIYFVLMFSDTAKGSQKILEDYRKMITTGVAADSSSKPEDAAALEQNLNDLLGDSEAEGSANEAVGNASGISPEFKAALDSYEQFFDEYISIMNRMKSNPTDLSLLSQYTDYMGRYADMLAKFEALEKTDMTKEELAYYLEVSARIEQKLLNAL